MAIFDYVPATGVSRRIQPKVLQAQFGDGYQQRVPDGINTRSRVWSLRFSRIASEIDAIEQFLIDRNGVEAFDWTPLGELPGKFICSEWTKELPVLNVTALTATFVEVFE